MYAKMDVDSNEDIDPELSENADMMLFAEDFVDHIMIRNCSKYCQEWNPMPFRDHIYNAFAPICKAVYFLDNTMEMEHDILYREIKNGNFVNSKNYEIFAKTLATEYFSEGFDAKYFLIYCLNLSIMANYFYIDGIVDVPDLAKIHIYKCLQEYDVSDGRWDAIHRIAGHYEKLLLDSGNDPTSPDISLVSDEIMHQDKEEEKVSEDLKSLQIEEQSISPGNEESNLEQLKESAYYLQYSKAYQKKYTQCSSKSRSAIGLCSLKGPESFSEDTSPRVALEENKAINRLESGNESTTDTSHVVQEFILITNVFKKKMNRLWNKVKNGN